MHLNREQKQAVETVDRHVLVLSGAGSGKTRVITEKIIYLLQHQGVGPSEILALTFTNKAAGEMSERVWARMGPLAEEIRGKGLRIQTFHSYGAFFLRRHIHYLSGYDRRFTILDRTGQESILKRLFEADFLRKQDSEVKVIKMMVSLISKFKCHHFLYPSGDGKTREPIERYCHEFGLLDRHDMSSLDFYKVYCQYQVELNKANALDFDDLIALPILIIRDYPDCHTALKKYKHVLVDEYQDTCVAQENLLEHLGSHGSLLTAVGDEAQSIYGFRWAHIDNILQFTKRYLGVRVVKLQQNYRSTTSILNLANDVIAKNRSAIPKELYSEIREDFPVEMLYFPHQDAEAVTVVEILLEMIKNGERPNDIAIFFRTNALIYAYEDILTRKEIPYKLLGGVKFFERKEIKEVISYLNFVHNEHDAMSCYRIINFPSRGVGKASLEKIMDFLSDYEGTVLEGLLEESLHERLSKKASKGVKDFCLLIEGLRGAMEGMLPHKFMESLLRQTQIKDYYSNLTDTLQAHQKVENLNSFVDTARNFEKQFHRQGHLQGETGANVLTCFMEDLSLKSSSGSAGDDKGTVYLTTVHNAKGLEFQNVFLVNLVEGYFPHMNAIIEKNMEEERRLFYVGITRAKRRLFLSASKHCMHQGRVKPVSLSRFIREVNPKYFEVTDFSGMYHEEVKLLPPRTSYVESLHDYF